MEKAWKWLVLAVVAGAVLVISPFGLFGPRFNYGGDEMRAAVVGRWRATVSGREYDLTIDQATDRDLTRVESHGWVPTAGACGSRSLIKEAGACMDDTRMPLIVADAEGRLARGEFSVMGRDFHGGQLEIYSDDSARPSFFLEATLDEHGNVEHAFSSKADDAKLVRLSTDPVRR